MGNIKCNANAFLLLKWHFSFASVASDGSVAWFQMAVVFYHLSTLKILLFKAQKFLIHFPSV